MLKLIEDLEMLHSKMLRVAVLVALFSVALGYYIYETTLVLQKSLDVLVPFVR
jgi:hypothetical protein